MRILVADDEAASCRLVQMTLAEQGDEILFVHDGEEAWRLLQGEDPPQLVLLDWRMPRVDGVELCRRIRATPSLAATYAILVTVNADKEDIVRGLEAGANDYVVKPFNAAELRARVHVGARVVELEAALAERVRHLEDALAKVKQLQGLLPICCYCKKIRDDQDYWHEVERYVAQHTDAHFSHGVCPECLEAHVKPELDRLRQAMGK